MKSTEIYEAVSAKIIAALKEGIIPWEREFTVKGGVHRSFSTHKAYRGGNQFFLDLVAMTEGYESPFWITMNQIKKNDGKLKKINGKDEKGTGQKSTIVYFFKPLIKEEIVDGKKVETFIPLLKHFRVFNLDQVEGVDEPELKASEYTPEEQAASIIHNMPERPEFSPAEETQYDPAGDVLYLSPDASQNETFRGLVESTAHSKRLNRTPDWGDNPVFSKEALIGEMGTSMLVGLTGIPVQDRGNREYRIGQWVELLEEKPRLVVQAASKAQGACDYIVPEKDGEDE